VRRIPQLVEWGTGNVQKDSPQLLESGVVEIRNVDGWEGVKDDAPFDAIHVGAAAATLPKPLVDQLRVSTSLSCLLAADVAVVLIILSLSLQPGGRLLIPVGRDDQELLQIDKQADGSIVQQRVLGVRYVPLVPGLAQ
jgi:protein-L-isoaspartate(D-aspartate) O-methyltransferase